MLGYRLTHLFIKTTRLIFLPATWLFLKHAPIMGGGEGVLFRNCVPTKRTKANVLFECPILVSVILPLLLVCMCLVHKKLLTFKKM